MAKKHFMNWSGVSFTPVNGEPVAITGVDEVTVSQGPGGSVIDVVSGDRAAVASIPAGSVGRFEATLNDPEVTGDKAVVYTARSAVVLKPDRDPKRPVEPGRLTLVAYPSDVVFRRN